MRNEHEECESMAKILGFEIKAVKEFKDHDGFPIYQGNVYFKNKKLGSWSQDAWGGPDQFDFDVRPYNEAMQKFDLDEVLHLSTPYGFTLDADMDILMGELMSLKDDEKMYKKFAKKGYPKTAKLLSPTRACYMGVTDKELASPSKLVKYAAARMLVDESETELKVLDAESFSIGEPLAV